MSNATQNWELGVVGFYDSFEDYDRFTQVGSQFKGKEDDTFDDHIHLDTSICTDFEGAPFYLTPRLGRKYYSGGTQIDTSDALPGSELLIGPSSADDWYASIEPATIYDFSGGQAVPLLYRKVPRTFIHYPNSTYEEGDQVVIRTVPRGWTPQGTFSSYHYGVMPVKRYDRRMGLTYLEADSIPGLDEYLYEYMKAVRLYTNIDQTHSSDYGQYIKRLSDMNTFDPTIRRWRTSWYYRIDRLRSGYLDPSGIDAGVRIGIGDGSGDWIEAETYSSNTETGGFDSGGQMRYRFGSYSTTTSDWTLAEHYLSPYPDSDNWNFNDDANVDFKAANRGRRFIVELGLYRGQNTAFDVDDLVIEHADGTTQEANGYYSIEDFPDPETISVNSLDTFRRSRLANGSLKQTSNFTEERPKLSITAEFRDVDVATYTDLKILERWVKGGYNIAFRPKIEGVPPVLVGVIRVVRSPSSHWSLNRATFNLEFEEA
jgi:hypothetical protein